MKQDIPKVTGFHSVSVRHLEVVLNKEAEFFELPASNKWIFTWDDFNGLLVMGELSITDKLLVEIQKSRDIALDEESE